MLDDAIAGVLRHSQPLVRHVGILRPVSETLDLVVALGSERDPAGAAARINGPGKQPVGVFLQARAGGGRVYTLTVLTSFCEERVLLRVSPSDVIFACDNEKNERHREKVVYDANAKGLVKAFRYSPFAVTSTWIEGGRAVVSGSNGTTRVIADYDPARQPVWRVRRAFADATQRWSGCSETAPSTPFGPAGSFQLVRWARAVKPNEEWVVRERRGAAVRHHLLPLSTYAEYVAARGHEYRDLTPGDVEIEDAIGPHSVFGDELWVGKRFYDGEGSTGVGGIAMFDTAAKRFDVFTGALLAGWSVSAIHADARSVWLSRVRIGELSTVSGGLVRFDRATRAFHLADSGLGIGCRFLSAGDRLLLGTDAGVAIVHGDEVSHAMFDQTSDGRVRVVASER
jgi:hypothetical protein